MVKSVVIVDSSFPQTISRLARSVTHELLVASPWITMAGAKTLSAGLDSSRPISLHIIARLDEADFLSGASHLDAFRQSTYPPFVNLKVRALPLLHAKMLIADRQSVFIGSSNMTEGGLWRNHEVSVLLESDDVGALSASTFFRMWEIAIDLEPNFFNNMERLLQESLPPCDETLASIPSPPIRRYQAKKKMRRRYIRPPGAKAAATFLSELTSVTPEIKGEVEAKNTALEWLERGLRFLPQEEKVKPANIQRLERLMYHPDASVRATAIDRAGRTGNLFFVHRLVALLTNLGEEMTVRSAAAFSLGLLGSPAAFSPLCEVLDAGQDISRWAKRSCFLLLHEAESELRLWFLNEINVDDPIFSINLVRDCNINKGNIADRLTKALIVEMLSTNKWGTADVDLLAYTMVLAAHIIPKKGKLKSLVYATKVLSEQLGVSPGDLRHGPLSPSLLRIYQNRHYFEIGLSYLLESAIEKINHLLEDPGDSDDDRYCIIFNVLKSGRAD